MASPAVDGGEGSKKLAGGALPELKKYVDKKVNLRLNGNRTVSGVLRGYDAFMNVVLAMADELHYGGSKTPLGSVLIRGSMIVNIEPQQVITTSSSA